MDKGSDGIGARWKAGLGFVEGTEKQGEEKGELVKPGQGAGVTWNKL